MSYLPLDREILSSTLWANGSSEAKVLWIYLLLRANVRTGIVTDTIPAIAVGTGLTIEQVELELKGFSEPDSYSRTKSNEGRRIEIVDNGIQILNYGKYRNKDHSTQRVKRYDERNPGRKHRKNNNLDENRGNGATVGATVGNDGQEQLTIKKELINNYNSIPENPEMEWPEAGRIFGRVRKRYGFGDYEPAGYGKHSEFLPAVVRWAFREAESSPFNWAQLVELSAAGFILTASEKAIEARYHPGFWWSDPGSYLQAGIDELKRWWSCKLQESVNAAKERYDKAKESGDQKAISTADAELREAYLQRNTARLKAESKEP